MFKRIVCAVDGSGHARQAVLTAAQCARELGATLTLLTVYRVPPSFEGEPQYSADLDAAIQNARALIEDEQAVVQAAGGPAAQKDLLGAAHPAAAILAAAASGQYDLLVMGTRGLGRLAGALLGSVSAQVAAGSAIPVLIVHAAEYLPDTQREGDAQVEGTLAGGVVGAVVGTVVGGPVGAVVGGAIGAFSGAAAGAGVVADDTKRKDDEAVLEHEERRP